MKRQTGFLVMVFVVAALTLACGQDQQDGVPSVPSGFDPQRLSTGKADLLTGQFTNGQHRELTLGAPVRAETSEGTPFHGYRLTLLKGQRVRFSVHGSYFGYLGIYRRSAAGDWGQALAWSWVEKLADVYTTTLVFEAYKDAEYQLVIGSPWRADFAYELTADCQSEHCTVGETAICSWSTVSPLGQTTSALSGHVVLRWTVTQAQAIEARVIEREQITAAIIAQGIELGEQNLDALFAHSDEQQFTIAQLSVSGQYYDWVSWVSGDTEVGAVFETESTRLVARISDGDVQGCIPPTPSYRPRVCTSATTVFPGNTASFEVTNEQWFSSVGADDSGQLTTLQVEQVRIAVAQLKQLNGLPSLAQVFDSSDDGDVVLSTLIVDGRSYDWVKLWYGDTEVGAIFAAGTSELVATVGDQDVSDCTD